MRGNVLVSGLARSGYGAVSASTLAAPAAPAEADAAHSADGQVIAVDCDADGLDMDCMEHKRQSRLARWQRQQGAR